MITSLKLNYNITQFENKFVFKDILCPNHKRHVYNDYTTLLSYLTIIGFDMVRL